MSIGDKIVFSLFGLLLLWGVFSMGSCIRSELMKEPEPETTYYDSYVNDRSTEVDKIIVAKSYVKGLLNYPDTADFHDMSTNVSGDDVTLKVTAQNAFGVPETYTFKVKVKNGRVVN
jgi:hypothetical protein